MFPVLVTKGSEHHWNTSLPFCLICVWNRVSVNASPKMSRCTSHFICQIKLFVLNKAKFFFLNLLQCIQRVCIVPLTVINWFKEIFIISIARCYTPVFNKILKIHFFLGLFTMHNISKDELSTTQYWQISLFQLSYSVDALLL